MFWWKYEFFLNNVSVSIYYDKTVLSFFFYVLHIALMWKRTKKYITNWAEDCIRSTWKQFSKWIIKAHWWAFMWMKESERKDLAATMGPKTSWGRFFNTFFFVMNKFNKFFLKFVISCFFIKTIRVADMRWDWIPQTLQGLCCNFLSCQNSSEKQPSFSFY